MIELHRHPELHMSSLQGSFGDITGRGTFLPHEQRLIHEEPGGPPPPPCPCMLGRDDEYKFIGHSGSQTFLARSQGVAADDAQIEFPFSDSSLDSPRIGDLELNTDGGVFGT